MYRVLSQVLHAGMRSHGWTQVNSDEGEEETGGVKMGLKAQLLIAFDTGNRAQTLLMLPGAEL